MEVPIVTQQVKNSTSIHGDVGSIPGLTQWVKGSGVAMSYGVGCRCGSDLAWLWLWCRLAAAALVCPLAWELSYAVGVALKKKKKKESRNHKSVCYVCDSAGFINKFMCIIFQIPHVSDVI